jgi:hypothetical protein
MSARGPLDYLFDFLRSILGGSKALTRKPPERVPVYPRNYYGLFGNPGYTDQPTQLPLKLNVPIDQPINPSVFAGDWKGRNSIASDPAFWRKYRARKVNAQGDGYEPHWHMTFDDRHPRRPDKERMVDIGTGTYRTGFTPQTPTPYAPHRLGVHDISTLSSRP